MARKQRTDDGFIDRPFGRPPVPVLPIIPDPRMAHAPDPEYWHGIILHSPGMAYWHGLVPYPYAYRWIGHGQRAATQQRYGFGAAAPEQSCAPLRHGALRSPHSHGIKAAEGTADGPAARAEMRLCNLHAPSVSVPRGPGIGVGGAPTPAPAAVLCASIALTPARPGPVRSDRSASHEQDPGRLMHGVLLLRPAAAST